MQAWEKRMESCKSRGGEHFLFGKPKFGLKKTVEKQISSIAEMVSLKD